MQRGLWRWGSPRSAAACCRGGGSKLPRAKGGGKPPHSEDSFGRVHVHARPRIAANAFSTSAFVFAIPNDTRAYGIAYGDVEAMIFCSSYSRFTTCCEVMPFTSKQTMPDDSAAARGVYNITCGIFARPSFI